jgi:acyl carrier protein
MVEEKEVKYFIENFSNISIASCNEDLMDGGIIDSLSALDLMTKMELEFDVKFSFLDYTKKDFFSVNTLTTLINNKSA